MNNSDVKKVLDCPSRVTLNLVLDLVNLKDKELKANLSKFSGKE